MSVLHSLFQLILKIRKGKKFPKKIDKYIDILKGLINFLYGKEKQYFYFNFEQVENNFQDVQPIPKRQKLMKDMGVLDLIIEIIYFNSFLDLTDDFYIKQFYEILYNLLRISIMEYRPNELYASQWLDFIRKIALEKRKEVGLNLALTELIDNNEKILTSRITSGMIESFVEKLKS
jgi:hypothetical protein